MPLKPCSIGDVLRVKMPAAATCDSHYCACLDHLGGHVTNRNDAICVILPKLARASTVVTVECIDIEGVK